MVVLIFMSLGSAASIPSDPSLVWIDAVKNDQVVSTWLFPLRRTARLSEPSRLEFD